VTPCERARFEAAAIFNVAPEMLIVHELTEGLPWVQRHVIIVAGDGERILTFAASESGEFLSFQDPNDLTFLNRFFEVESIRFPDGLPAEQFADSIRMLVAGPGGFVGTPRFLESEREDIAAWLRSPVEESQRLFEFHTKPPSLARHDEHWRLCFFYFNREGAVEQWIVEGNPGAIESVSWRLVLPKWTFRFPYV
jgi:hypothetical protein